MENKKYLFCDLDGTILFKDENKNFFKEKDIEFLQKWVKTGHELIFTTGRSYKEIKALNKKINIDTKDMITTNGSVLFINNKIAKINNIDSLLFKKILIKIKKYNYQVVLNDAYESFKPDLVTNKILDRKYSLSKISYYKNLNNFFSHKSKIISLGYSPLKLNYTKTYKINKIFIDKFIREVLEIFKNELTWYVNPKTNSYIDIVKKDINKLDMILEYQKIKNIDDNDIYIAGDGINDVKMINYFKNSYIIENNYNFNLKKHVKTIKKVGDLISLL